jgi:hypothetical protein
MAITGTKQWVAAEVVTAVDVNRYLMRGVKVFASAAARDAAYGGTGEPTLEAGETCYLLDTLIMYVYNGTGWDAVGGGADILQVQIFS